MQKQKKELTTTFEVESSFIGQCFIASIYVIGVVSVIAAIGGYRSQIIAQPTEDYAPYVKLDGKFKVNERLSNGTRIFGLHGPESIAEDQDGNLYTGLADGRVVRIAKSNDGVIGKGKLSNLTNGIISNVAKSFEEASTARPLGIRVVNDNVFVADAVHGVYSVNLNTKIMTSLVAPDAVEPKLRFANDLCVSKDGNFVYFTDASSKHSMLNVSDLILEGICDGRVLQYSVRTKEVRTVVFNLCIANGIQLSDNDKLLFVSESYKYRIRIVDTQTWKTKKTVHLPMAVDNIRPTGRATYWIAGFSPWSQTFGFLERNSIVRQIISGWFTSDTILSALFMEHNIVVEMTEDGLILQSLHDTDGDLLRCSTQALTLSDGRLAVGTVVENYLVILDEKHTAIGFL